MTTPAAPVEIAFALLKEGRLGDAEDLMTRELQDTAARHGEGSPEWASVQCDLGNVLLNADQAERAVSCFRKAASVPGSDYESRKDQLTYRLNLGVALQMVGRLDDAETELRQGLQERLAFYGREHAGYAFGLDPLARLLLQRGDLRRAREIADEAVANLRDNRHERVADLLALRAVIAVAEDAGEAPIPDLDQLPDELVEQFARGVLREFNRGDPASERLLTALVSALQTRLGPDNRATISTLSVLANLRADLGEHAKRVEAVKQVLASYDRQGQDENALMAALGLAMAQDQAGDTESALHTYASAYARAERLDSPELRSQVLRNWGLTLKEAGDAASAEKRLREGLAQAWRGSDYEMAGRAGVALGIFLQHEEQLNEARTVLTEALDVLPPEHPDAIVGRSHLGAVSEGRSCGCGNLRDTMAAAFREFVLTRLPSDLIARLDVTITDDDFHIEVGLQREPTKDELDRLNSVMRSAQAEFRRKLRDSHHAS